MRPEPLCSTDLMKNPRAANQIDDGFEALKLSRIVDNECKGTIPSISASLTMRERG